MKEYCVNKILQLLMKLEVKHALRGDYRSGSGQKKIRGKCWGILTVINATVHVMLALNALLSGM